MSEFTPGPWVSDGCEIFKEEGRLSIGEVVGWDFTNEWEANAKLIAAAPDLYEALKAIHDALKTNSLTPEHQNEALKALSKATD